MIRTTLFALSLGLLLVSWPVAAQDGDLPIEIVGPGGVREGYRISLVARLPSRRLHQGPEGFSPQKTKRGVRLSPPRWERPTTFEWDFGDGTVVTIKDRTSVAHRYEEDGSYTVVVKARDDDGVFASASHSVEVTNFEPREVRMAALEIDPGTSTVELTAGGWDTSEDPLTYSWDFGDGGTETGEDLWRVRHQYLVPGTYEAQLVITDDEDGEKELTKTIVVSGADSGSDSSRDELEDEPGTGVVVSGFSGRATGAVAGSIDGVVRSFRGVFLQAVDPGVCRFMFSAWDDSQLAWVTGVLDLPGVPPEGAKYRLQRPLVGIAFESESKDYLLFKNKWMGPMGAAGLGALMEGMASFLPESDQSAIGNELGIGTKAREPEEPVEMPAMSPLGITERKSYLTESGTMELTFIPGDRAIGRFDLSLSDADKDEPSISLTADFALDLQEARRDGVVRYEGCEPPEIEISVQWPEDGSQHLRTLHPPVRVRFTERYEPETLNEDTFQVAYRDPNNQMVPVDGRLLRNDKVAWWVPEQPLRPGVRHTARVAAGREGVRALAGGPLEDTEGDGWRSWTFTTKLDMVPETEGDKLVACHIYQTARDPALIAGKPAVARVYASWLEQPDVHPDDQIESFEAEVQLRDADHQVLGSVKHTFVRPDLWESRGIDQEAAEHTAQIHRFVPGETLATPLRAVLMVPSETSHPPVGRYRGYCPAELWDHSPKLTVDFVALPMKEWAEEGAVTSMLPVLRQIVTESMEYAWQLFPVAEITGGVVREVPLPMLSSLIPEWCGPKCMLNGVEDLWGGMNDWLLSQSSADIVVGFIPHGSFSGGYTRSRLTSGRGSILMIAGPQPANRSRYVNGLVHEIGHVLDLEHEPFVCSEEERAPLTLIRTEGEALWHEGIEGLLMSRNGGVSWNKSSIEGNEENSWLVPLMYPGTVSTDRAFIANHQYRAVQCLFERLNGGGAAGACPPAPRACP